MIFIYHQIPFSNRKTTIFLIVLEIQKYISLVGVIFTQLFKLATE